MNSTYPYLEITTTDRIKEIAFSENKTVTIDTTDGEPLYFKFSYLEEKMTMHPADSSGMNHTEAAKFISNRNFFEISWKWNNSLQRGLNIMVPFDLTKERIAKYYNYEQVRMPKYDRPWL